MAHPADSPGTSKARLSVLSLRPSAVCRRPDPSCAPARLPLFRARQNDTGISRNYEAPRRSCSARRVVDISRTSICSVGRVSLSTPGGFDTVALLCGRPGSPQPFEQSTLPSLRLALPPYFRAISFFADIVVVARPCGKGLSWTNLSSMGS